MTRTGQKIHPNPAPELLCRASEIDARFQETQVAIKTTEVIKMTAKGRFATILIALTVFGCKGALQTSAAKAAEGLSSASAGDPAEHECAVDGGVGLGGLCTGPENGGGPEHWADQQSFEFVQQHLGGQHGQDKLPDERPERESERRIAGELDQADGGAREWNAVRAWEMARSRKIPCSAAGWDAESCGDWNEQTRVSY